MTLLRALHAETLKLKRTLALKMVLLAPAVLIVLVLIGAWQAPFSTISRFGVRQQWTELAHTILRPWALLVMPLYITLEAALLAGLDHAENQWRSLLARPLPRWNHYTAKLVILISMSLSGGAILFAGILADGLILPHIQPQLTLPGPAPWRAILREAAQVTVLGTCLLTIQYWVSLRWKSFAAALGAGIVALIVGIFAFVAAEQTGGWPQYFPWSLSMIPLGRHPQAAPAALLGSALASILIAFAGCLDWSRRDVS